MKINGRKNMKIFIITVLAAFIIVAAAGSVYGKEWIVNYEGDSDPKESVTNQSNITLRQAVENSSDGDTIILNVSEISLNRGEIEIKKDITIKSNTGKTIIKRNTSSITPEMRLLKVRDSDVTLDSIKFQGATVYDKPGGALSFENASGEVKNCEFTRNRSPLGPAVYILNSEVEIKNCYIGWNFIEGDRMDINAGALYSENSEIEIENSVFERNTAKTAPSAYIKSGDADFENCYFSEIIGTADRAGSVFVDEKAEVEFKKSTFEKNNAVRGGAVYTIGNCSFSNCYFRENKAIAGKDETPFGGAICCEKNCKIEIKESVFEKNEARLEKDYAFGAGNGGAVFCDKGCFVNIKDSSFGENYARYGGAVYVSGKALLEKSVYYKNRAKETGGAIAIYPDGNLYMEETVIIDNKAEGRSGAENGGGGIFVGDGTKAELKECVIINNEDKSNLDVYTKNGYVKSHGKNHINNTRGANFSQIDDKISTGENASEIIVIRNDSYLTSTGIVAGTTDKNSVVQKIVRRIKLPKPEPEPTTDIEKNVVNETETGDKKDEDDNKSSGTKLPGYSALAGITGSLVAVYLIKRRKS